jgi:hypothetical protein
MGLTDSGCVTDDDVNAVCVTWEEIEEAASVLSRLIRRWARSEIADRDEACVRWKGNPLRTGPEPTSELAQSSDSPGPWPPRGRCRDAVGTQG